MQEEPDKPAILFMVSSFIFYVYAMVSLARKEVPIPAQLLAFPMSNVNCLLAGVRSMLENALGIAAVSPTPIP